MARKKTSAEPVAKQCDCNGVTGDATGTQAGPRHFDGDPITWLIGQAIARLHAAEEDREGQGGFQRATELLARLDSSEAFARVFQDAQSGDAALRWSLLYVLAETGDARSAGLFARIALDPIRVERDPRACETAYDGEVLVRTMAIEALARLAPRNPEVLGLLHRVVESQPDRALRVEAVKAILAAAPEEIEALRKSLPEELQFALSIKHVRAQALAVEHDIQAIDGVRAMPALDGASTRPATQRCCC